MTAAELKYLIALDKLYDGIHGVKLVDVARELDVSKVSVHKAMEKLEETGHVARDPTGRVCVTELGNAAVREALVSVYYLADLLEHYCWMNARDAYCEAVNAVCAVSDTARKTVAKVLSEQDKN